jgi:hypothetical protein
MAETEHVRWPWRARLRHGVNALETRPYLFLAAMLSWALLGGMLLVFAKDLVAPYSSGDYKRAAGEYRHRADWPGETVFRSAFGGQARRWRIVGAAGMACSLVLQAAMAALLARFGGAVLRGQAELRPWACRYPLRFRADEWRALETVTNGSGVLAGSLGSAPRGVLGRCVVTGSLGECLRLAGFLEGYDGALPPALGVDQLRSLAVSLRELSGRYYIV